MAKSLDKTLEAFQNVEDAIVDIKTQRNVMTDKTQIEDYGKILVKLEKASEDLINAMCYFRDMKGRCKSLNCSKIVTVLALVEYSSI